MKSFLAAVVAVLVWFLVWDNFLADMLIGSAMAQLPGLVADMSRFWGTVGDVCGAAMLVGVYARTRSVWGVGAKSGAIYGVYAGLLISFPHWLFMGLAFGWPYGVSWIFTVAGTALNVVAGAIAGTVYQMTGGAKT